MTEERYTSGPGDETDGLVSKRYRELAHERAPEHLDRAVLKAAADAARPRYSRLRSWTRPVAWAATIMLSVVLVLEISQVPAPDESLFDVPSSGQSLESTVKDDLDAHDSPVAAEALQDSVPAATALPRSAEESTAAPGAAPTGRVASPQPVPATEPEQRQRSVPTPDKQEQPDAARRMLQTETQLDQLRPKETDMLQRAEELARSQAGDGKESAAQPVTTDAMATAAFSNTAERADAATCGDQATVTPATWLECIEALEAAGLVDEALRERERLRQSFPDFELP